MVHSSLCHGDLERVHACIAEVLQHGLLADVAEMCGVMPRCRIPDTYIAAPWAIATWRALPERGRRSSVLSCRMRAERLRHGWH